jgi:hypothetical protein
MRKKEKIEKITKQLRPLIEKQNLVGLTTDEQNQYTELNHKLDVVVRGKNAYPKEVYTKEFGDKLDNIIRHGDELIAKLS